MAGCFRLSLPPGVSLRNYSDDMILGLNNDKFLTEQFSLLAVYKKRLHVTDTASFASQDQSFVFHYFQ
jgi:hypothetical protein